MARVRLDFHGGRGIRAVIGSDEARDLVNELADQTAEACNRQSSWGGYFSADASTDEEPRALVWSADDRNDEARDNRMIRNLP